MLPRYYYERKKKNKLKTQIIFACIFISFSVIVALFYLKTPVVNMQEVANTMTTPAASLQSGASVEITRLYVCGHTKKEIIAAEQNLINKKESEIAAEAPQWKILKFEPRYLTVEEKMNIECDDHYIIKLTDNNKINVYRKNNLEKTINEIKINPATLTDNDRKILKSGIAANSEYELLEIMESFSS